MALKNRSGVILWCNCGFGLHGEDSDLQNRCTNQLRVSEPFVRRTGKGANGAKQLETLGKRDADFPDGNIIQNVGRGHAGCGTKNIIQFTFASTRLKRRGDVSKNEHQWKEQHRSNNAPTTPKLADWTEAAEGRLMRVA